MLREEMTKEQEIEHLNKWFDIYEKEGFSKVFITPYDLHGGETRNGESFKVLGRVKPMTEHDNGEDTTDLENLPMWTIQFEDGETMGAYPEEIIPSEIRDNIWRVSDIKLFENLVKEV